MALFLHAPEGEGAMPEAAPLSQAWPQRQRMRALGRRLRQHPAHAPAHLQRLQVAQDIPGAEPLQGCIADLFHGVPVARAEPLRTLACELAQRHLPRHVAQAFSGLMHTGAPLEPVHWLATRWSVLAQPSAATALRQRRVSGDESRRLAEQVVRALAEHSEAAPLLEQEFLAHCSACHDTLAFMLARRALLQQGRSLEPAWLAVAQRLEEEPQ